MSSAKETKEKPEVQKQLVEDAVEVWMALQMSLCLERQLYVTHTARGTEVTKFIKNIMPMWLSKHMESFWNGTVSEHREKLAREISEHDEAVAGYPYSETEDYEKIKSIADLPLIEAKDLTSESFLVLRGDWYLSPGFVFMKDTFITITVRQMNGMPILAPQGDSYSSMWILRKLCEKRGLSKLTVDTTSAPGPDSLIMTQITVNSEHEEWIKAATGKTKESSEEAAAALMRKELEHE